MDKATCSVEGCEGVVSATGLCKPHYQRRWYEKNRERALAYAKARYDSAAAAERHRRLKDDPEYQRVRRAAYARWVEANPDGPRQATRAWREANAARVRETMAFWRERNRESLRLKKRANNRLRRGRIESTQTDAVDYAAILAEHGMFCHICSMVIVDLTDLHFDHVIPLALGGPHSQDNIKPAHAVCNMRKGARIA